MAECIHREPVIYVWDIETGFNVAGIFQLLNHNMIHPSAIMQEKYLICAAFKQLGKGKTFAVSIDEDKERFKKDPTDDYYAVKKIHGILSGADAIIHHYGDKFDIRFFNSRVIYHGLPPLPPMIQIDTYKIAKKHFMFNSNRLDYIGKYLGVGGKIKTSEGLWMRCFNGEKSAIKEMVKYNKQDVDLLEKVYLKLQPYAPAKLNMNLFDGLGCPTCGSGRLAQQGTRMARTTVQQRYKCQDCGSWSWAPKTGVLR